MSEAAVKTAARMYEARDTMRRILGPRFKEQCAKYEPFIRGVMLHRDCDELEATLTLLKLMAKKPDSETSQMMLLAAAVEMIEPSEATI